MNKILRKNIITNKIKNNLVIDKYSYDIFKNEIKKICELPKKRNYPYFPLIFSHLMSDSIRMWLFLNDEEIYSKIQDECSIHILINSFFLTIIINLLISYNNNVEFNEPTINEYIYYISGTTSMTFLICAVSNIMIIITNINKSNTQLIRFELAKNINNFSNIFKLSAYSFYTFIFFISLALYTTQKSVLNYICSIFFLLICMFYSSPLSIAYKTNYDTSPRLMLNFIPWSEELRERSIQQIYVYMLNFKNTNIEFSDMIDNIISDSNIQLINDNYKIEYNNQ